MSLEHWQTKPTDRFVLKWIKVHLSSRITPGLRELPWLEPWMVTVFSASIGVLAGAVFAMGCGWVAGCLAALSQVLDGVDGQYARLTGKETRGGAFWDSVLDRYTDGAMVMGLIIYLVQLPIAVPKWLLLATGFFALVGSNLISYSSARAESLAMDMGPPTLASKGTRSSVIILCAWGSVLWSLLPLAALIYLAAHTNAVVINRLLTAREGRETTKF